MVKKTKQATKSKLNPTIIVIVAFGILAGIMFGYFIGSRPEWKNKKTPTYKPFASCQALMVTSPPKYSIVSSPLTVTVVVDNTNKKCHWTVFEAHAGKMELKNARGQVIGTSNLVTQQDWMTDKPVNYLGTINFDPAQATERLKLVITEENPSGEPGQQIIYPLTY